jgi:hypothetical protein
LDGVDEDFAMIKLKRMVVKDGGAMVWVVKDGNTMFTPEGDCGTMV